MFLRRQDNNDAKSSACQSESLSQHYIKAKKFAAYRKNQKKKKFTQNSDLASNQGTIMQMSPPVQAESSLYIMPGDSEQLRHENKQKTIQAK